MNNDINKSNTNTVIILHNNGWIAFSPFSKRIAFIKSEKALSGFVQNENNLCDQKPECSRVACSKSVRRVALILTKDCPMSCIYCYAHAGESKTTMTRELALRSIREAAKDRPETLHVTFFGGEPTLCMDTISDSVDLAQTLAEKCQFHLSTGGVVLEKDIEYLISKDFTINLSMDGPPDIQNRLRPLPQGMASSKVVEQTIRKLVSCDASFKVRCTVTNLNVQRLAECVKYWAALGVRYIHFEPINIVGRAAILDVGLPDADVYIENFLSALDTAEKHGVGLINSAYMNLLNPSPCYCTTVAGDKLMVAPDGSLTLCYEVQESTHPLQDFVIGKYDLVSDKFIIDSKKEKLLHAISVESYRECEDCFAKYVCSGGCPNRNLLATGNLNDVNPWICEVKKALIRDAIIRIYKASKTGKPIPVIGGNLNREGSLTSLF